MLAERVAVVESQEGLKLSHHIACIFVSGMCVESQEGLKLPTAQKAPHAALRGR